MEKEIKELIAQYTVEDEGLTKVTCSDAFRLAVEHKVDLLEITKVCNSENIRICKCQLGCFK